MLRLCLAVVLPLAAGTALWRVVDTRRGPGASAAALGHGLVFGCLLAAAATAALARADTQHALRYAAPALGVLALVGGVVAWRRYPRAAIEPARQEHTAPWVRWLLAIAFASLACRGWLALREIWLRPIFPWDAWDAWAVKGKVWYLLGHAVPFVPFADWLRGSAGDAYTSVAASYPGTLGWLEVWFAAAAGGWVEPVVDLPWFLLWLGLLFGHYGQWRALGVDRVPALFGVYALGSLPLITVHVALAGNADLWVAAVFGFGVLAWLRYLLRGERLQALVAASCALLLPWLKLEGAVWLVLAVTVAAFAGSPRRLRRYLLGAALGAALGAIVLGLVSGHLHVPLWRLGWVHVDRHGVEVPGFGRLAIAWHPDALRAVLTALYIQPNWHLLWWLAPLIVIGCRDALRAAPALRALGGLLALGLGFLLFLFLGTDASRWAESYTAINRLVMQLVPALCTFLVMSWHRKAVPASHGQARSARGQEFLVQGEHTTRAPCQRELVSPTRLTGGTEASP
jgi:succinate dehydrogenase hydrophobic anchor subunit